MARKISLFFLVFSIVLTIKPAFCFTSLTEYLCELGVSFYRQGRYEDALSEFKKALLLEPDNKTAKKYIDYIFRKESIGRPPKIFPQKVTPSPVKSIIKAPEKKPTREEAIDQALRDLTKEVKTKKKIEGESKEEKSEKRALRISGETQIRLGMSSQDTYWKRANWDLNEKNWRMLSSNALDRRESTYDARLYDRLRINLDTGEEEGFGFHSNITVDPWSFTGKSEKITLIGAGGDPVEIELKYWSNTGYTLNETVNTLQNGDSFSLPEIKVTDGHISTPVTITSAFNNIYTLAELKIQRQFQPLREVWFDYRQDDLKLRLYPIAYENQALTSDDPLRLSNNHIWWEDSPWIRAWKHGVYNSGASPVDFTKGYWDKSLSFFARDSEGQHLTSLRGFTFEFNPQEETSLQAAIASPKTPWQDYSDADNILTATRLKQSLTEDLHLGFTATTRTGYNLDESNKLDAWNCMVGTDLAYEIVDGIKASVEVAHSHARYDLTNSRYETEAAGNTYYFSLLGRFPSQSILDTEYGYDGIQPEENESFFTKFRFFACRMDESFDAPLSSYVETRDDEWWSRHLHFRQPFKYYYQGEGQLLTWDDVKVYRIGNGIDIGRNVLGLRIESLLWDKKIDNLFDMRNVHEANGKFVENVAREELSWTINDRLTSKFLGIYHRLPKTHANIDPFIFDTQTRRYFNNDQIEDGKDPSVATGSLGLEYEFFDWLALNGIWEYTNDISLCYDNFPRGILNGGSRSYIFYENGNKYRDTLNWLNSQQYFPKPPYPYYNIFKAGLRLDPTDKLEIYLDYTRNPYEKAGQVDDNMNHIGLEVGYKPTSKLALFFKYTYSRWQDLDSISQGITKIYGHHNVFTELIYRKSEDEDFTFQYGEASRNPFMGGVLDIGWDPYGGSLRTIDTPHIFRLYYRRKF